MTQRKPTNDGFVDKTSELIAAVRTEVSLDPYDPARPALVKQLQASGNEWVAKYAPGGAANRKSAKKVYVALSALQGCAGSRRRVCDERTSPWQLPS